MSAIGHQLPTVIPNLDKNLPRAWNGFLCLSEVEVIGRTLVIFHENRAHRTY